MGTESAPGTRRTPHSALRRERSPIPPGAEAGAVLPHTPLHPAIGIVVTGGGGVAFFWWIQHFLLCGRIGRPLLLPGALLTVAGLAGLRFFSVTVFSPLIAGSAVSYGPIGTVLIVQCWLIGIGFVIYAGSLAGQGLYERKRLQ